MQPFKKHSISGAVSNRKGAGALRDSYGGWIAGVDGWSGEREMKSERGVEDDWDLVLFLGPRCTFLCPVQQAGPTLSQKVEIQWLGNVAGIHLRCPKLGQARTT